MLAYASFASGSSGNCSLITSGDTHILIDAGISARQITASLNNFGLTPDDLSGVFVTHDHGDHIAGLPMLCKKFGVPVFCTAPVQDAIKISQGCRVFRPGDGFDIGGMTITSYRTPHDSDESCGFRICSDCGRKLAYATDLGHVPDTVMQQLSGCDMAVLESNYDRDMLRLSSYPPIIKRRINGANGHLCNDDCAKTALILAASGCRTLALAHLSEENNSPDCAYSATFSALADAGALNGFNLFALPRSAIGEFVRV